MTPKVRTFAALLAATITSCPALGAQDASHKLTAMDEFQLQLPTDPQISPDGKKIAYVRRFADPMTDKRYSNLWIINTDGTDHRPLTTGNRSDVSPRWSPDGLRLAYLSDADGKQQLYVRWMDTAKPRASPISNSLPTLSPGLPMGKCSPSPLSFWEKVRTSPIFRPRPPAQNGPILPPPTIVWSIVSTGRAISNPATCKSSSLTAKAAHPARSPTAISRMAATNSAPLERPGHLMPST